MSRWKLRSVPWGIRLALAIVFVFLGLDLAGLRDWVSVVSGTPVPDVAFERAVFGGLLYVVSWFALVIVAPILALASLLHALLQRWRKYAARDHSATTHTVTSSG